MINKSLSLRLFLSSIETYLLILLMIYYTLNLRILIKPTPLHVHQLESLDELEHSLIRCQSDRKILNSTSDLSHGHECPIDRDRLNFFDNDEIDLNPSLIYAHIKHGGHYKVIGCDSKQKIAIIIPFRNREQHLEQFSLYIHRFLPDQLVDYSLYVIEQTKFKKFNRAKLFNIGVAEILRKDPDVCCFIFHDVDLIPLDQRNLYMCSNMPRHMSVGVSQLRYKLLYPSIFGGVVAISRSQFEQIGGYSNDYYGWGGEDDDLFNRVLAAGLEIERTPAKYGVYNALFHSKQAPNPER